MSKGIYSQFANGGAGGYVSCEVTIHEDEVVIDTKNCTGITIFIGVLEWMWSNTRSGTIQITTTGIIWTGASDEDAIACKLRWDGATH